MLLAAKHRRSSRSHHACLSTLLLLISISTRAELIDRIAVSVANQVITEDQINEEIRVTAFLDGKQPQFTVEQRQAAAERLIQQLLLQREMGAGKYPLPDRAAASEIEEQVRKSYPSGDSFQQALRRAGISEEKLLDHLRLQLAALRFIEYRFQPSVQISETEIIQYYEKQRAEWERQGNSAIPTLDEARSGIERILTQQRVDQALDRWMGEARTQVDIRYRKKAFQ